jgi:hypothetical protein
MTGPAPTPAEIYDLDGKARKKIRIATVRCVAPGCGRVTPVFLQAAGKKATSICDGAIDPQGLGCSTRVFWSAHRTAEFVDSFCQGAAITAAADAPAPAAKKGGFL